MIRSLFIAFFTLFCTAVYSSGFEIEKPDFAVAGAETQFVITAQNGEVPPDFVMVNGEEIPVITGEEGKAHFTLKLSSGTNELNVSLPDGLHSLTVKAIPGWLSVIPPLLAIFMALITREVLGSLFAGIFSGGAIIGFYTSGITGILRGFVAVFDRYVIEALNDTGRLSVIVFSMTIGAVVAVISKNGGMRGVVNHITKFASTPAKGQLATYFLGIAIFFDDYANTLVVGNTMRSVTDKLRVSREKLAYIVDSTAAPIAATAFVTTWIGAELGYIQDGIKAIPQLNESAYSVFLSSLSYSFYPVFTLVFVLLIILTQRDFASMFKAEHRARTTGKLRANEPVEEAGSEQHEFKAEPGIAHRPLNAIIPVFIIIAGTMVGLFYTGSSPEIMNDERLSFFGKLSAVIGESDPYAALLWSSLTALIAAVLLTVSQRLMNLEKTMNTVVSGFQSMMSAVMILVLAWALARVTDDMETAVFLKTLWSPELSPVFIPAVTFLLAAVTAFSTGSSWGTMAILYPLLLPAAFSISTDAGYETAQALPLFYNVTSCVLAGSVLGDHCSPISDTTILSSLASGCNHIDHVRTQLPYALIVGGVSVLIGTLPAGAGVSSLILYPVGIIILYLVIRLFGKSIPHSRE